MSRASNKFWLVLIMIVCYPILVGYVSAPKPEIYGKFSYGGMRITLTGNMPQEVLITVLKITYCDGTHSSLRKHIYPDNGGFTYIADRPMQSVKIITTNPNVQNDGKPRLYFTVTRKCSAPTNLPELYCNNVTVAHSINRSSEEPISFKSTRFVFAAGLKILGVDGIVWVRKINIYPYLGQSRSLAYQYSEREWTGTFPSMYIPVGAYRGVELIVQDEYGQQAKCRIGNVEILP